MPACCEGTEFDLRIGETGVVNVTGRPRTALAINGSMPGPTLRWREGDTVTLGVSTASPRTSIHWHGIILPLAWTACPVLPSRHPPGTTFPYRFPRRQSGTYWYHRPLGLSGAEGVYGPLVIEPGPIR